MSSQTNDSTIGRAFFAKAAIVLTKYRKILFIIAVVLSFSSLFFAGNIKIDNSLELWFLEDDPTLKAYREFKKQYGNDEIILAMVDSGEKGQFSQEMLNKLYAVSKAIKDDKKNIKRVLSVGLAPYIGLDGQTLIVEDLITEEVKTADAAKNIEKRFYDDPLKPKLLTDLSKRYAILLIEPVASDEMDVRRPIIINSVKEKLEGLPYKLAGMGVMYDELNRLSIRDGLVFTMISYIVIGLVVFFLYRSIPFLLTVILVMVLGGCGFIGIYGLFKQNFNMVTIVLPTLMMILSISDVAYVFNNYCFNISKVRENKIKGIEFVFTECLSPCLFTSITNCFGFLSLVSSSMAVLRGFGIFAAAACMLEYFVSMVAVAFVIGIIDEHKQQGLNRPFEGWVDSWVRLMPKYYRTVLGIMVIAACFGIYGITKLEVDTYSMGFLHETNPIRMDSDSVEAKYGNYLPLEVRLITDREDGVKDPDFLKKLDRAHTELESLDKVQRAASIIDVFKKLNQVMSDGSSSTYRVPETLEQASQLMLLYESDPDNDLKSLTDSDYREARLTVRLPMVSAAQLKMLEKNVSLKLNEIFDNSGTASNTIPVKIVFGGYVPLYARIINYITASQVTSFLYALISIFITMAILLKRFGAMFLGIIPNVFPILMTLGMMGIVGIKLDIATVTIASIALGIAVDDTVHELFLFYEPSRSHLDPVESISEVIIEAGPAVISTSIIYALGFSALIFASIKSVILFGGLLAITIVFGMLCEITFLPALVCLFKDSLGRTRVSDDSSSAKSESA
ncbi:MAG: MMPL family transporter [Candidatus Riflebacteria bacterium]|nr:MMPL family transporter [Candidatus Riflebacteria bacterium]